jgi:hypothetical protein
VEITLNYFDLIGSPEQIEKFQYRIGIPLNDVFEKAEVVLDIFPQPLQKVNVRLFDDHIEVRNVYRERYNKPFDGIAFISLGRMEIVISIPDTNLHVFVHEVGHAIVEQYFKPRPSYALHELMAQYCEKHISD